MIYKRIIYINVALFMRKGRDKTFKANAFVRRVY